jgi:hypothetical protein
VHAVFLDGVHHEGAGGEVAFHALPRLESEEVARVLEDAARRITRYLERRGLVWFVARSLDEANDVVPCAVMFGSPVSSELTSPIGPSSSTKGASATGGAQPARTATTAAREDREKIRGGAVTIIVFVLVRCGPSAWRTF